MSLVEGFLSAPLAQRLGWVFLHFLWQGALVAGALALTLSVLRRSSASARYAACCAALALLAAAPVATFLVIGEPTSSATLEELTAALARLQGAAAPLAFEWRSLVPALALFWALGALVQQVRLLVAWFRAQRLKQRLHRPVAGVWERTLHEMARALGIRRPVRLVESALAEVPTVIGWLAPVVLVPSSALLRLSPEQLRMILAHELAHVRRHDYLVNLIQTAIESVLFFHPAVWWVSHRVRIEREFCCDDVAVELSGDALTYARALERLESLRHGEVRLALASTGGSLMQRIQRLVSPEARPRRGFVLSFLPALFLLVGVLATTALGFAQSAGKGELAAVQDMSDDELADRISELQARIAELEHRIQQLKHERGSDSGHRSHGEVHLEHLDGETFEVHIPEMDIPEIVIPKIHTRDFTVPEVRIPEIHTHELTIPEIVIPKIEVRGVDIPEIVIPRVHVPEVHFQVDPDMHQHIRETVHENLEHLEHLRDVDWKSLDFAEIQHIDVEDLHKRIQEGMKHFHESFDADELHDRLQDTFRKIEFHGDSPRVEVRTLDSKKLDHDLQQRLERALERVDWGRGEKGDERHDRRVEVHVDEDLDAELEAAIERVLRRHRQKQDTIR